MVMASSKEVPYMHADSTAVTGIGVTSALGTGCNALWDAIQQGRDGLRPIMRFSTEGFSSGLAGLWPAWDNLANGWDSVSSRPTAATPRVVEMALVAADEAWGQAGIEKSGVPRQRVALVLGTCFGERLEGFHTLTEAVAEAFGADGPRLTISTACSSSANAIGLARDLLRAGVADVVMAGGADALWPMVFAGFHALGALTTGKCTPFSELPGTTLGEGAGFLVLERLKQARARGAEPLALVLGYGLSADAYHPSAPDPTGSGIGRALRGALSDAGLQAADIDYVNAHGTGTAANDAAECRGLAEVLSGCDRRVPMSSSKSFLGHGQGAAGVLELIVTILAIRRGKVPPTMNFTRPRPGCAVDAVGGQYPRSHPVRHALGVSAGFGGANAVVAVGRVDTQLNVPPLRHRPVTLLGVGGVGPGGSSVDTLALAQQEILPLRGPVGTISLGAILPTADPRGMDPVTTFVTAAAKLALDDAGITVRGTMRDRAGIVLGTTRLPVTNCRRLWESIEQRGLRAIAAPPFSRNTVNSPAGACAKLLALRGPHSSVSTGPTTGLAAIIYAAEMLAEREDSDLLLAVAADEVGPPGGGGDISEGAVSVLLARRDGPIERETSSRAVPSIDVVGWGIAGPGCIADAARSAGALIDLPDGVLDVGGGGRRCLAPKVEDAMSLPLGYAPVEAALLGAEATAAAWAAALAVRRLRRLEARSLLVTASGGRSAAYALRLAARQNDAETSHREGCG
jgi:3-oxoacyl-[acyl-carrier-protein] synthase II